MVAAAMSRALGGGFGIIAVCLVVGLLGSIAITGRWPTDAPRTHMEAGGILPLPIERVVRIEFSADDQPAVFSRTPPEGWLFNGTPIAPAVAGHIDAAVRLLAVAAPRRVLAAGEFSPDQLSEYGLDPPSFALAITDSGGAITRVSFGEMTPARNAQYARIAGRPELYLVLRDVGEEWQLAYDMGERGTKLLLPVSIARIWAVEILARDALYRFERDPAGLWFHHIGQHAHLPGGPVHRANPAMAPLIEAELAALDRIPITRTVAPHHDTAELASGGLEHPATILLIYGRDTAGPVARIEFGNPAADGRDRYARIQQNDALVIAPDDAAQHLTTLLLLAGTPS
jgi:hypothetical protein